MPSPWIEFQDVSIQRNGQIVLANFSWKLFPGQYWAIWGANGSGKSSLMQALRGQLPYRGRIFTPRYEFPQKIALVSFEQHQAWISAEEHEEFFRQFSTSEVAPTLENWLQQVEFFGTSPLGSLSELLHRFRLNHLRERPLLALSNGEMRKFLIVRALLQNPELLILDEPYDGLDAIAQIEFKECLAFLAKAGLPMILISHHRPELTTLITHVLKLESGKKHFEGSFAQFEQEFPPLLIPQSQLSFSSRTKPSLPSSMPLVRLKNVTVRYDQTLILDRFNWEVKRGEHWGICGPNGSGKTTLMRLITGEHLQAYCNEVEVFGKRRGSGEDLTEIKRKIGWVSPELQTRYRETATVGEVVLSGFFDSRGLYQMPQAEQKIAAQSWLQRFGWADWADRPFLKLSYGQKRWVLLARALVKSPELLILDEPTQGLDEAHRQQWQALLTEVVHELPVQCFYLTHHPAELPQWIQAHLEFQTDPPGFVTRIQIFPPESDHPV